MQNDSDWTSIAISALALLVAARAAHSASRGAARATELQARLVSLEESREADRIAAQDNARMSAYFLGSAADVKLCLRNDGLAPATDVLVSIDGISLKDHPRRVGRVPESLHIASGAEVSLLFSSEIGSASHLTVRVTWRNPAGSEGMWESDLSIY